MTKQSSELKVIRWIARISGTVLSVFFLVFVTFSVIGEIKDLGLSYSTAQILTFLFWGIALLALLLAVWREGLGGIISVSSLILMFISGLFIPEANKTGMLWVVLILATPSILYIYYWHENKKNTVQKNEHIH